MDQKTIIEGLQKALVNGSGNLDDLDNLLKRAQADIVKAKEEAKNAEAKRGQEIAELANRLLENKTTDSDAALVLNAWLHAKGYKGAPFSAADLEAMFFDSENAAIDKQKYSNEQLKKAFDDLMTDINDFVESWGSKSKDKNEKKPADDSADDVINRFLKNFGLR